MRKTFSALALTTLFLVGCSPIEATGRDLIASSNGVIIVLQKQYQAECSASPKDAPCVAINKAISGQNLAIDALESYCGGVAFNAGTGPCVPNKALAPQLTNALQNLNSILIDVKGLVK